MSAAQIHQHIKLQTFAQTFPPRNITIGLGAMT